MLGKQSTFTERKTSHSSAPKEGKTGSFFGWRTNNSAGSFFTPVSSPAVQPKLTIGQPGDKYEQEADAIAEQVVQAESIQRQSVPEEEEMLQGKRLQRQTYPEEEELLQSKPLSEPAIQRQCAACEQEGQLQRQAAPEEEEMLQAKPLMRVAENGAATAMPQLASQLNSSKGSGQTLPKNTLSSMNNVFGTDFSSVRVHTGSRAQEMSQGIQAKAFTHGSDIYFNRGQYNPGSTEGKRLLGHELTHVVQQGSLIGKRILQRDKLPCFSSGRVIDIYVVYVGNPTRDYVNDINAANDTFCQCGIEFNVIGGESWVSNVLDDLAPNNVLNEYPSPGNPTAEEEKLLSYRPGGKAIHLYYVPSLSAGNEAEAFWKAAFPTMSEGVVVSDGARGCAFPHELGHVLLNDGAHHSNQDNLMAPGSKNTCASELEQSQCDKI